MSIIDTLKLRCYDPVRKLSESLDEIAKNPKTDVSALFWGAAKP